MDDDTDELLAEAEALGPATLHDPIAGSPDVFGSRAFFATATEVLLESTRARRELGGACFFVRKGDSVVLVGLARLSRGKAAEVAIQPSWGSVLWHTHPGRRFSLAAFSTPDIEGARVSRKPLLVIGYRTASPDVLGLTVATGLLRGGEDPLSERLLRMGVAAQICWPSGAIHPVRRFTPTPLQGALDEASFRVDRALGAASRAASSGGLGALSAKLAAKLTGALGDAKRRGGKGPGER